VTLIVELTVVVPVELQVAPVMLPLLPPPPVLLLVPPPPVELEEDEVVPPELPLGIEHSFTDFEGAGSDPKVATLQEKDPFNTLYTNAPDAPNATLVDLVTEQV
jgi:hypothetical protein